MMNPIVERPEAYWRPSLMPADVDKISTDLAVLANEVSNVSRDMRQLAVGFAALVTRAELAEMRISHAAVHTMIDRDIKDLKDNQGWAVKALIMSYLAGVGLAIKVFFGGGGH